MKPLLMVGRGKRGKPDADMPRTAVWLRCQRCEHAWVAAWLPMTVGDFLRVVRGVNCPNCAAPAKDLRLAKEHEVKAREEILHGDLRPPREPPDRGPTRQPEKRPERKPSPQPSRRKGSAAR